MTYLMKRFVIIMLVVMSWLPMAAQLTTTGTGYYRARNVANTNHYITIANDKFNYDVVIDSAGGGGTAVLNGDGKPRCLTCVRAYLQTDIHMVEDRNGTNPATVLYLKKNSGSQYNLIAQSTSLLELTNGQHTFPSVGMTVEFKNNYATISKVSGTSGATTQYTAKVELKKSVLFWSADLGTFYFADSNGIFAISETVSDNSKWYLEPITSFNVDANLEYKGKFYCTMYTPFAYTLSAQNGETMKAYAISAINADGTLQKTVVASNGSGTVPAGTPVILECSTNELGKCQLVPTGEPRIDDVSDYSGTNLLKGAYFCNDDDYPKYDSPSGTNTRTINNKNYTKYNSSSMLVLGVSQSPAGVNRLGFFPYTGDKMKSNKVWLDISGSSANANYTFDTDELNQKGVTYE